MKSVENGPKEKTTQWEYAATGMGEKLICIKQPYVTDIVLAGVISVISLICIYKKNFEEAKPLGKQDCSQLW